jgi:uncharacterized protein (UPF0333 family)
MKRAQLSVEFIILMSIVLLIGSTMIISQVRQMSTFDAIGDSFQSQTIAEKNAVVIQAVSVIGSHSLGKMTSIPYEYTYSHSSYLTSMSYQKTFIQSAIPGTSLQSQSLANYSQVSKSVGGFAFE